MRWLNTIDAIVQKLRITWRLRKLEVTQTGTDEGMPFVELKNGLRFFGLPPGKKDLKYHRILFAKTRTKIPFESYKVAMDIVIRYEEGSLKIGGPKKERFYQASAGDTVVEMGAYMGFYTLYLAQKTGESGRVIAIEPMEDNLKFLRKNIAFNGFDNVEIIDKGVWKKNDTLSFTRNMKDKQSASLVLNEGVKEEFNIEVRSLDHIMEQCTVKHVDFMIIQLNGTELEALEGLELLNPDHLAIAARYRVSEYNPVQSIVKLLKDRGYRVTIRSHKYIFGNGTNIQE